jgi:hypothetical protein
MSAAAEEIWAILREVAQSQKETERRFQETERRSQETERRFQETERKFQETERRFQETANRFQETANRFQETERRSQETERRFQETANRFQETECMFQETKRMSQETERRFQETDRQFKATDQKLKQESEKLSKALGRLGNRLGDFIEDAVRPAAVRLFQGRGIEVHEVHQNIEAQRGEEGIEVDLMVVNDMEVVAIECKSNLTLDDVREHLERLGKLKRLLPTYRDKRVLGAVAAMVIPDNVAKFAYRQGLFVIGQSGEHLRIRNGAEFTPKAW